MTNPPTSGPEGDHALSAAAPLFADSVPVAIVYVEPANDVVVPVKPLGARVTTELPWDSTVATTPSTAIGSQVHGYSKGK